MKFTIEYFTVWGESLVLHCGAGAWRMNYVPDGQWSVELPADEFFGDAQTVEYFYEVQRDGLSERREWRVHTLDRASLSEARQSSQAEPAAEPAIRDWWSDVPGWKGAGTAIPLFALRSEDDFGVGEFHDLKKLVDWAVQTGQTFLQILPVNDTAKNGTIEDSYPYNAVSSFALHPQYIHLPDAGVEIDAEYIQLQKELNAFVKDGRPETDYVRVNAEKQRLLRKTYDETKSHLTRTKAYKKFLADNEGWLLPYAVFSALCKEFGSPDFSNWGEYAAYDKAAADAYAKAHKDEVGYYVFLQFHLDRQFREARDYAHRKGVWLKGDLPIGVSRHSADTWQHPQFFNMDSQAGAPPDAFSADGQNWGFPTYNWDAMEADGYGWWKARLAKMGEYFDAVRIDHILGFFRIWEIPLPHKSGLEGSFSPALPYSGDELRNLGYVVAPESFIEDGRRPGFYCPRIDATGLGELYEDFFWRRHNEFWADGARKKLSALLGSTHMLACGEDLGMIPACVPEVMRELGILSLEVQRMPKGYGETFGHPADYPYSCVCTTSTHDISPLRAWWEEDPELSQRYFNEELGCPGEAPRHCEPWLCHRIVARHLASPAMLVILPLQDWLSTDGELRYEAKPEKGWSGKPEDERINIPAVPRFHWDYRMHLSLEELLEAHSFNKEIARLVKSSGR